MAVMGYHGGTVPRDAHSQNMTKMVIWDDHPGDDFTMVGMSGSTSGGPDDPCHVDDLLLHHARDHGRLGEPTGSHPAVCPRDDVPKDQQLGNTDDGQSDDMPFRT